MQGVQSLVRYLLVTLLFLARPAVLFAQEVYREPPPEVVAIVDARPTPLASASPDGRRLLLIEYNAMPSIAKLAEPVQRLGGIRINPRTNDQYRTTSFTGIVIRGLVDGQKTRVALPAGARLGFPVWSHDGTQFALTNATADGTELWVVDAASGKARKLIAGRKRLNGTLGSPFTWIPGRQALLCRLVPEVRGLEPAAPRVPTGPRIEETSGKVSQVRTYQDLLKNARDEVLFDYYTASQLAIVDSRTGAIELLEHRMATATLSPNGQYLLVTRLNRPFSRHVPHYRFARTLEIRELKGGTVFTVADLPVADDVPIEGVPTGPRSASWRPLEPATLMWVEALDGGDPHRKVPYRDRILMLRAPFHGKPREISKIEHRFRGLDWLERKGLALVSEYDRDRRWSRTTLLNVDDPSVQPKMVWDLSIHDRYGYPGRPVRRQTPNGKRVVRVRGDWIYLAGRGASPKGDRPFLDRLHLESLQTERLFQCEERSYESFYAFAGDGTTKILTQFETRKQPPNFFLRDLEKTTRTALTHYKDPAPWFTSGVRKELLRYKRADGVPLSATLYLPPGYQQGQRLPLVVWAYPREYTGRSTAGQVRAAPNRFTRLRGTSQLFFLTQGYAVLDGAQLPIIGDPETVNETFVEQLISGARAAIYAAVEKGVADPDRVGIGGHSYGAFMTANLLAHTDLFRAGIARSGAYNRTLTPFGFQSERRTLWQALETYVKVSPFMHADEIDEPILLIHGEMDNNSGTFPIQSERLYHALKGHGATARLVMLPHESHGYRARESVLHVLAEMFDWFDKHVKEAAEQE